MIDNEKIIKWLLLFNDKIQENKQLLSQLDAEIGDSDHGNNMARGMEAVKTILAEKQPSTSSETLKLVAMTLLSKVGGASGPLYGSAFLGMSQKINEGLLPALSSGLMAIKNRGKSTINEKTMIDVWQPVVEHLENQTLTVDEIMAFAENTKSILATKGRASYLGERSIGHIDPGAYSSALLFIAMLEVGLDK